MIYFIRFPFWNVLSMLADFVKAWKRSQDRTSPSSVVMNLTEWFLVSWLPVVSDKAYICFKPKMFFINNSLRQKVCELYLQYVADGQVTQYQFAPQQRILLYENTPGSKRLYISTAQTTHRRFCRGSRAVRRSRLPGSCSRICPGWL